MLKMKDYLKTVKSKRWLFVLPFCVELTKFSELQHLFDFCVMLML